MKKLSVQLLAFVLLSDWIVYKTKRKRRLDIQTNIIMSLICHQN